MIDPNFDKLVLFIPFVGSNGSQSFVDFSNSPKVIVPTGSVALSSTQSKFYGVSGYFPGSSWLKSPYNSAFEIGTGKFTMSAWVYPTVTPNGFMIITRASPTYGITRESSVYITNNTIYFYYGIRGTNQTNRAFTFSSIPLNTWSHIEISRDSSNIMRCALNGTFSATTYTDSTNLNGGGVLPLYVGAFYENTNVITGYLQDVKLYVGEAIHTSDFTLPEMGCATITGNVYDPNGDPCNRTIHCLNRNTGTLYHTTASDTGTGAYTSYVPPGNTEISRIVLANESTLYNDLIDRIIPD